MSWEPVILEAWREGQSLTAAVERLLESQRRDWPAFQQGEASLSTIRTKDLRLDGACVTAQANPGRKRSTHAKTDAKSIAERRCFLCAENMPREERGVAFGDLVILPNPFPVLPWHCTIPAREHTPQRIAGRVATMLELASQLGTQMFVFYNGPRCGASAPDHFHFQACLAAQAPVLAAPNSTSNSLEVQGIESFGRRYVLLTGADPTSLATRIEHAIDALQELTGAEDEPMLNLLVHGQPDGLKAMLFPRAAHRPACYFTEAPDRLAVSPAALEMAGLLVCAEPEHFDRLGPSKARKIYEEVSLDANLFSNFIDRLQ